MALLDKRRKVKTQLLIEGPIALDADQTMFGRYLDVTIFPSSIDTSSRGLRDLKNLEPGMTGE